MKKLCKQLWGNLHRHSDLPCLLAGKLGGKFQTGYHLDHKPDTPMANLLVTMLNAVGVRIAKLGDSTGQLLLHYNKAQDRAIRPAWPPAPLARTPPDLAISQDFVCSTLLLFSMQMKSIISVSGNGFR